MHDVELDEPEPQDVENSQRDAVERSPGYRNGKFSTSATWKQYSLSQFPFIMWDFLFSGKQRTPDETPPAVPVDRARWTPADSERLDATWLGHSSLLVNIDGCKILLDPVFQRKLTFFGPSRFSGDAPVDPLHIEHVDVVLISHDHYDHLNKPTIRFLADKADVFIVPLCDGELLASWGVAPGKIVELGWWQDFNYDDTLSITATPAQHFSGRGVSARNESLWLSYAIKGPRHNIFFSGDSGYFDGFKKIGDTLGPFDMTFIECGAYSDMWRKLHMFPEETVQAHLDLKGKVLHPIHWGTFNLAMHPWYEPMKRLTAAAEAAGVPVSTPIVGDTTVFESDLKQIKWWETNPGRNRLLLF